MPLVGIAAVAAIPLARYAEQRSAESAAARFLDRVRAAQQAFAAVHPAGGFATDFESLTRACSGQATVPLPAVELARLERAGYRVELRAAEHAAPSAPDCHGRPTTRDFYVAAVPAEVASAGRQALAATSVGPVFVFFDGIAPAERDMGPDGLATPIDQLGSFKIP